MTILRSSSRLTASIPLACAAFFASTNSSANPGAHEVVAHYTDIANALFEDSLTSAKALQDTVQALLDRPSASTLQAARNQWRAARVPYQQTEALRFGNPIVDEWEGQVNAWPLDEGLIDYVSSQYHAELGNIAANANIIASPKLTLGNTTLDLTAITPDLLQDLNELGGSEANVATGYHAIEFLLWGQDLNGTNPGAGNRPYTDFATGKKCTNSNCERRRDYLKAATELLINDLQYMHDQWKAEIPTNYRQELLKNPQQSLQKMLFGMGSLSLGELAGERMKVALEAGSTEDEHDCFSDNTHYAHYYDAKGIENIYFGRYLRIDGSWLKGPSISDLVKAKNPQLDERARQAFAKTDKAMQALVDTAEDPSSPMKFDQMIAEGNTKGAALISNAINALVEQTGVIEAVANELGIEQLNSESANHEF